MIKYTTKKIIEVSDWDSLVEKTYGRPYSFQQQNGCQPRGTFNLTVPDYDDNEEYYPETVPEIVNGNKMGVKFSAWLARNPKQKLKNREDSDNFSLRLWWERNFYPPIQSVANDLYEKGLMEAGEYLINIDW